MAKYCKTAPDKGTNLFYNLKKNYGYDTAWRITVLSTLPNFLNGKSFRRDSEGFPLMEDLIKDSTVKKFIGKQKLLEGFEKNFQEMSNTRENFSYLVNQANLFNRKKENEDYIAIVEETDNNTLKINISFRSEANEEYATNQYAIDTLNRRLVDILNPLGITIGELTEAELSAGRVGITDFSNVKAIADSCVNVIRAANNMEGSKAISEEFSHLVIGSFKDEPLIQRALNLLSKEDVAKAVLGDEYDAVLDFQDGDMSLVAEEALGQLLQENLLAEISNNHNITSKVLDRVYANIRNKFKDIDAEAIINAINEASNITGQIAKKLINKELQLSQEKIKQAQRQAQFNSLSERIDTNKAVLKKIKDVEVKRYRISPKATAKEKEEMRNRITELSILSKGQKDTRIGIYNYADSAVKELKKIEYMLNIPTSNGHPSFAALRRARSFVQSYAGFIEDMNRAIILAERDSEVPEFLTDITLEDGTEVNMSDIIKDLSYQSKRITTIYSEHAKEMIADFFRPFFGSEVANSIADKERIQKELEDIILEASKDISFTDLFLDSMADSSDRLLLLVDSAIKQANDNARHATIRDSREVQRLIKYADENGITDFEWMFEKYSDGSKSGNYISRLDYAKFEEEKKKFQDKLDEKYGERPTGKDLHNKLKEFRQWLKDNADPDDYSIPKDIEKYRNKFYESLKKEDPRKKFLNEFMKLKLEADAKYPIGRVSPNKAIQVRKTSGNRLLESISNSSTLIENIKEDIKQTFLDAEDDDTIYGREKTGLTNFDGTEYMALPVLYTNRLRNPNELSTDVFASLLQYQYATNTYKEMDNIVDPIEVVRNWVNEERGVAQTRGGIGIKEKINAAGEKVVNKIYKGDSNIARKLNELIESSVYQRYIKDEGTFGSTKISVSKTANWILKSSSLAQLGFNYLANIANAVTGVAMTNIEAYAGEYFNARQLWEADCAYKDMLPEFLAELGSRTKTNKLDLFDEFLNVRANYDSLIKSNKKKSILQKMFGSNIAFLGQDAGDHWLYNRIAIAVCKATKVLVPKSKKRVPKIRSLSSAEKVIDQIIRDSLNFNLTQDEKFYYNSKKGYNEARVTSVIAADGEIDAFEETHEDGTPNNWITPSTNIGTGIDELVRDFFAGLFLKTDDGIWHHDNQGDTLEDIYPNMTREDIHKFLDQLQELKADFEQKGLVVDSRGIVASGTIPINVNGEIKDLRVAGTLDLLVHDMYGNFYIYDMKTHRGKITSKKRHKWSAQLSLYKKFLEEQYGIQVKGLHIIPIKVNYDTPKGEVSGGESGTVKYEVEPNSNQLLADGKVFKDAKPSLEDTIEIPEIKVTLDYNLLGYNQSTVVDRPKGDYIETNLWDALEIVNSFEDRDDIKEMILPEGTTDEYGNTLNIDAVSRRIQDINGHLFGLYNQEDSNVANRVSAGRAIQQFRKWMKPQFNKRFQTGYIDKNGIKRDGYYVTFGKYYANKFFGDMINQILRGKIQIASNWDELSDVEKANIKRAKFEILQYLAVSLLVNFVPWPDEKNRPFALKLAEYSTIRAQHELSMLTLSPTMPREMLKTIQSPMPVISSLSDLANLGVSLVSPSDWMDEKQSGPYKGLSTLEANFLRAPLYGVAQYRQIDKFLHDIDTSINFYARPY